MNLKRLAVLSILLCGVAAGVSVVVETFEWWLIDAGSSWTVVIILGYLIAMTHGAALAREKSGPSPIIIGATIIGCSIAFPILAGFGLKSRGLPVPWREPAGSLAGAVIGNWLILAVLIVVTYGLAKLISRVTSRRAATA